MEGRHYKTIVKEKAALNEKSREGGEEGRKRNLESGDSGDELLEKSEWFHFHLSPQALVMSIAQLTIFRNGCLPAGLFSDLNWKKFSYWGKRKGKGKISSCATKSEIIFHIQLSLQSNKTPNFESELGVKYTYIISALVVGYEKAVIYFSIC